MNAPSVASGPDFSRLTPLEYLSLADRERIHTETIRWLLSDDSPLVPDARIDLLSILTGSDFHGAVIDSASTEHDHLDLLVKATTAGHSRYVAIENKLKSAEHSSQLSRYDEYLSPYVPCDKAFLTLIEQQPSSSTAWTPVSYSTLASILQAVTADSKNVIRNREYVADYQATLGRLVGAVHRVVSSPDLYAGNGAVFPDPIPLTAPADFHEFASYVEKMRLRTVLQKAWMLQLGQAVSTAGNGAAWDVGETRGAAHLGFDLCLTSHQHVQLLVGLQLQNRAFKVFCAPEPYEKGASAAAHTAVETVLASLRSQMGIEASPLTPTRDRGFRSFSPRHVAPEGTLSIVDWEVACRAVLSNLTRAVGALGLAVERADA